MPLGVGDDVATGGGAVRPAAQGAVVGAAYRGNVRRAVGDVLGPQPPCRASPDGAGLALVAGPGLPGAMAEVQEVHRARPESGMLLPPDSTVPGNAEPDLSR